MVSTSPKRIALLDVNAYPNRALAVWIDDSPESEADCMQALKLRGHVSGEVCRRLHADSPAIAFAPFESWQAVIEHVQADRPVYYHAPFDFRPARVGARLNSPKASRRTIRIDPMSRDADPFTADAAHLDRFCRK
jgi:hypothetical protein